MEIPQKVLSAAVGPNGSDLPKVPPSQSQYNGFIYIYISVCLCMMAVMEVIVRAGHAGHQGDVEVGGGVGLRRWD